MSAIFDGVCEDDSRHDMTSGLRNDRY